MAEESYETYVFMLENGDNETMTPNEIAAQLGVGVRTIYRWNKKVDWDRIKEIRRKKYAEKTVNVDNAMYKAAFKGDVAAGKLWYERFDNWTPTTAQKQIHEIDEHLVDEELFLLMERKRSALDAISNTLDAAGRKETSGTCPAEGVEKAE
jgi:hypothetical protein